MKSPPFSASRVALVAAATISSTLCESASRRNFVRVWRAAAIAVGVRLRPSRPPAPSRTMSFSRSMTSKDRSGRTWTTIMWIGVGTDVDGGDAHEGAGSSTGPGRADIYLQIHNSSPVRRRGRIGRHPTMNRRAPRVTTLLLQRRARALARHLPAAVAGDDRGVHQARVDLAPAPRSGAGPGHRAAREQGRESAAQDPAADPRAGDRAGAGRDARAPG